jgi:4-amino-4-deoxy-L-arabinose transferase-like glycosyltransferase
MHQPEHQARLPRGWLPFIAAGLAMRILFIAFPRPGDDDTLDYLQLGHNLLHQGIYGAGTGSDISPSLYRLPAYPIFLASFEQLFSRFWPTNWMNAVFVAQLFFDIAAGLLLAAFARRHLSERAGRLALALAMLCPFTAVYSAIAMPECLTVFAIALGVYSAGRALAAEAAGQRDLSALLLAGCASALAMLLRPDGALLFVSLAGGLFYYTFRSRNLTSVSSHTLRRSLTALASFCLAALLPLSIWTARNWVEFHVFQPLAPRYLNDPGDRINSGFYRWTRTWAVEYVTTANVLWEAGEGPIDTNDLDPSELNPGAFDSPQQRVETLELIAEYNRTNTISPELDSRFASLAAERIRAHPFRYYVTFPVLRVADMLLRPRTLEFDLDVFWWRWSEHHDQTAWAILLGLINLFYVAAAAWAFVRRRVPWAWMLGGYLVLRFLMLGTIEHPEPRYTVECFPIFVIAAAAALTARREPLG